MDKNVIHTITASVLKKYIENDPDLSKMRRRRQAAKIQEAICKINGMGHKSKSKMCISTKSNVGEIEGLLKIDYLISQSINELASDLKAEILDIILFHYNITANEN